MIRILKSERGLVLMAVIAIMPPGVRGLTQKRSLGESLKFPSDPRNFCSPSDPLLLF